MKKKVIETIEKKFEEDIRWLNHDLENNAKEINKLVEKQKEMKNTRKGLYEILNMIKGENEKI